MKRVHWIPNQPAVILLVFGSLWIGGQYLKLLSQFPQVNDLVRVGIWGIAFIITPFLIWRLVELVAAIFIK